ncbi:DUF1707 domain-containing protein [Pseudonocardia sp. N23]|uniref:DUF1707 SHOCT-like domain-containing protein n=1 Tax=Pseudonocardia sp. N23 TaxID=1987376 RepID=UPI000BFDCE0A|nr:DUF1707 domain-containing protein [Pseudonocardia sp. N23]GAY12753.1 hypothetical protein TOK_1303 [Pseudonocardia sp. N23]
MTDEIAPQDLRVSHEEREHVTRLLAAHFSEGRLTVAEYDERTGAAASAVTRADLNRLLLDLPGAEGVRAREVLELSTTAGDLKRDGAWTVPPKVMVRSRFGNANLDFRNARFTTPVVTVEADLLVGDLEIRLPKGATVDLDDAGTTVGNVVDKIGPSVERGMPHVVVRGGPWMGNVRVR